MKPQNYRPAFPRWLRRIDPSLEAEDRNVAFQIFRERRLFHSKPGLLRRISRAFRAMNPLYLLPMLILGSVGFVFLGVMAGCFIFSFVLVFVPLLLMGMQRKRRLDTSMPIRVEGVFSLRGVMVHAARDLWLCGVNGEDVLEAIYLEAREKNWFSEVVAFVLIFSIISSLYCFFRLPYHLLGISLIACMIWLGWEIFFATHETARKNCVEQLLRPRMDSWASASIRSVVINRAGKQLGNLIVTGLVIFILIVFMCGIGEVVIEILDAIIKVLRSRSLGWLFPDNGTFVEFFLCCVFVVAAIAVRLFRKFNSSVADESFRQLMEEARFSFDYYMSSVVMEDPDGAQWAKRAHAKGSSSFSFRPAPAINYGRGESLSNSIPLPSPPVAVKTIVEKYTFSFRLSEENNECLQSKGEYTANVFGMGLVAWEHLPIPADVMTEVNALYEWYRHNIDRLEPADACQLNDSECEWFNRQVEVLIGKISDGLGPSYTIVNDQPYLFPGEEG